METSVFMSGIIYLRCHRKIRETLVKKGINEKTIIISFYNDGDMDGCWMRNSKTS